MEAFELDDLITRQNQSGKAYLEFLQIPSLSAGIYRLPANGIDPQRPHTEDEVYYVISVRGAIRVGAEDRPVQPGSTIFVRANVDHRFHSITEDLTILV